jgi:hypothetical protein
MGNWTGEVKTSADAARVAVPQLNSVLSVIDALNAAFPETKTVTFEAGRAMSDTGFKADALAEALKGIPTEQTAEQMDELARHTETLGGRFAEIGPKLRESESNITAATKAALAGYYAELQHAANRAQREGEHIGDRLHDGIVSGKEEVKDAMMDLRWAIHHPAEDSEYLAWLEGRLTGKALKRGLKSEDESVRQQAQETRRLILEEYRRVSGHAYNTGVKIAEKLEAGLKTFEPVSIRPYSLRNILGVSFERRQHGGPVQAGTPYVVGEKGPEVMVPNSAGHVLPNAALTHASATGQAHGAAFQIVFNAPVYGGPTGLRQLARDINDAVKQGTRGAGWQVGR